MNSSMSPNAANSSILTVSQLNFYIKSQLEGDFRLKDIFITGEISNFTNHYKSGHLYFSLKDEKSVIRAVMFAGNAKRLKFAPQEGMKIILRGRITVYEPSGQYQINAVDMQPDGIGALSMAFEQLKEKLNSEGLFDQSNKQSIPSYPSSIAVITSPTGAAVQDILQITARRWPVARIELYPVLVQGEAAPAQLVKAMRQVNALAEADVIIIGRGGGSIEDLQAFNDEELAREIFASEIPVISAVGHETDFSISDFVADLRAPTPSAAAELCTPDILEELSKMMSYNRYFFEEAMNMVEDYKQDMDRLTATPGLSSPENIIKNEMEKLERLDTGINNAAKEYLNLQLNTYNMQNAKLEALSPQNVFKRGFSVLYGKDGAIINSIVKVKQGDQISIKLTDGSIEAVVAKATEFYDGGVDSGRVK